jgi:hypothetical protein
MKLKEFKQVKSYLAPPGVRAGLSVLHYIVQDGVNDFWLGTYHDYCGGAAPKGDYRDYLQTSRTRISRELYDALKAESNRRRKQRA